MKFFVSVSVFVACCLAPGMAFFFTDWNAPSCKYSEWSDCYKDKVGQYVQTRSSKDPGCLDETSTCTTGAYTAYKFLNTFMSPPVSTGNSTTRGKRQASNPVQKKRDLLIILDESGSIGYSTFQKSKEMAAAIVHRLCSTQLAIHKNYTRVGVMTFSDTYRYRIPFYLLYKRNYLEKEIRRILYSRGSTCLKRTLEFARDKAFTLHFGGRPTIPDVQQDIILITDGCPTCHGGKTKEVLQQLSQSINNKGIRMYVFGINLDANCQENLKILAQGGNCNYFYYIKSADLQDVINSLKNLPTNWCQTQWVRPGPQTC